MNMYEAIFMRKSVRHYRMEEVEPTILYNLSNFINHVTNLEGDFQTQIKIVNNLEKKNNIGGLFTVKAPYYIIVASEDKEDCLLNLGYIMGQLSLYLATKALGTCFLTSPKIKKELVAELEYEHYFVLAFGYAKDSCYRDPRKIRRMDVSQIALYKNDVDNSIRSVIKGASYAPSCMNSQPWRFIVYDNRIHVFCKKDLLSNFHLDLKQVDIGIMLSYLFVSAEEQWLDVSSKKLDNIADKHFRNNNYVISVLIK